MIAVIVILFNFQVINIYDSDEKNILNVVCKIMLKCLCVGRTTVLL